MMAALVLHGLNKLQAKPKKSRKILIAPDVIQNPPKMIENWWRYELVS